MDLGHDVRPFRPFAYGRWMSPPKAIGTPVRIVGNLPVNNGKELGGPARRRSDLPACAAPRFRFRIWRLAMSFFDLLRSSFHHYLSRDNSATKRRNLAPLNRSRRRWTPWVERLE